jgi:hypothetical protein
VSEITGSIVDSIDEQDITEDESTGKTKEARKPGQLALPVGYCFDVRLASYSFTD